MKVSLCYSTLRIRRLLSKKSTKAQIMFARKHTEDHQEFWDHILRNNDAIVDLFGRIQDLVGHNKIDGTINSAH